MKVSVSKPNFGTHFKRAYQIANVKGVSARITTDDTAIYVTVNSPYIKAGVFTFSKFENDDTKCELARYLIIDRGYYPLEFAITELTNYLKRRKIKYIYFDNSLIKYE